MLELRKMLEYVPDMVFLVSCDGQQEPKIVRSAGMVATEFKLETEDIAGLPLTSAIKIPDIADQLSKAQNGELVAFEVDFRDRKFLCTLRPFDDFNKEIKEVVGSLQEITTLHKNKLYSKGLAGILNLTNQPAALFNTEFKLVGFNPQMGELFGYSEEELVGEDFKVFLSNSNPENFISQILPQTLTTGWNGELRGIKQSGVEFPMEAKTEAIRDENGDFIYMACLMRDLSRYIGTKTDDSIREREMKSLTLEKYAESMQEALSADQESLSKLVPETVVMQRSNQTLSKSLAWMNTQFNSAYMAVLQAEGTGVLGELEAFTGYKALSRIVSQEMVLDPNRLLSRLDESLQLVIDEGIDLEDENNGLQAYFLGYDPDKKALKSAGAGLDMLVIKADKHKWFEGAKQGLGIETEQDERLFSPQSLSLDTGDMVILCSCTVMDARPAADTDTPLGREGIAEALAPLREKDWDTCQSELQAWFEGLAPADRDAIDLLLVGFRAP